MAGIQFADSQGISMLRTRRDLFGLARGSSLKGTAALLAARGHEAYVAELQAQGRDARPPLPPGATEIRISSNENPLGPGRKALDAITGEFPEAGRYPFNSTPSDRNLVEAIAAHHKVKPENVTLGSGSQEILKSSVRAFTSPTRGLVTANRRSKTRRPRQDGWAIRSRKSRRF